MAGKKPGREVESVEPGEEPRLFHIGVSPHIRGKHTTTSIMRWVIAALLPLTAYGVYIGGTDALVVVLMSVVGAVATEAVIQKLRHLPVSIGDLSAVVTGLLLALTLPPGLPFWMPLLGGVVAIALGKQVFGGLGHNIFNPALVGRAVLFISWSEYMTTSWLVNPQAAAVQTSAIKSINAVTSATPLATMGNVRDGELALEASRYYGSLLFGNPWGCIGEVSALLILAGLVVLLIKGLVYWGIPVGYVGTVVALSWVLGMDPLFAALSGGLLLGACFMATDYVTNPMTARGKLVFAVGCGIITVVLRFYSNLPEGVMFAILVMNGFTPLIDRYITPRPYGHKGLVKKV
ncbi:MAG: RnfABCDGE type electron transport complex subunit D [Actinomycetia bacterium]|nr:RnfABCDGE type electron transport complex subunit D [Actinomycetota bacterium]MBU4240324.1 RnfABCDGE type electron transport complex subunit D [Actinomycetota bacterium]MCG2796068.1 RnfABCDGE type electron transport complex subunit D [Actinomycetes bacterium]